MDNGHDLSSAADGDSDRFVGFGREPPHVRHGGGPHVDLSECHTGHLDKGHPERVAPRLWIVPDDAFFEECSQDARHGALVEIKSSTYLADGECGVLFGELPQNGDGSLKRLMGWRGDSPLCCMECNVVSLYAAQINMDRHQRRP